MALRTSPDWSAWLALRMLQELRESAAPVDFRTLYDNATATQRRSRALTRQQRELANDILADCIELGLVRVHSGDPPRYSASDGDRPPHDGAPPEPVWRDDAEPPGPPPGDGPAAPDDGGSGIGEVLAHPVLFSLSEQDFQAAVARSLESYE